MKPHRVTLHPQEMADLDRRFPLSQGSNQIGGRAIEVTKIYFRREHPDCSFVTPVRGADLAVSMKGVDLRQYEVKGTAGANMSWQQLKVSSKASYELLTSGKATVLRVTNVYGDEPLVFEMRCGVDFRLEPEPRWCVKPIPGGAHVIES